MTRVNEAINSATRQITNQAKQVGDAIGNGDIGQEVAFMLDLTAAATRLNIQNTYDTIASGMNRIFLKDNIFATLKSGMSLSKTA